MVTRRKSLFFEFAAQKGAKPLPAISTRLYSRRPGERPGYPQAAARGDKRPEILDRACSCLLYAGHWDQSRDVADQGLPTMTSAAATVEPKFLGVDVAAVFSGLSPLTVRRLVRTGRLPGHRPLGPRGPILIDRESLVAFVRGELPQDQAEQAEGA